MNWSYAKAGFITLSVTTFNQLNTSKIIYKLWINYIVQGTQNLLLHN